MTITYHRGGVYHVINLFHMRGSVFPQAVQIAAPCAFITGLLKFLDVFGEEDVLLNSSAWGGFSFLVGFLVVFRTSQAYSRFWDGSSKTHQMRAEWFDAASALCAFCQYSKADQQKVRDFKRILVRMFSVLHAVALAEIQDESSAEAPEMLDLELIDPAGIDAHTWQVLKMSEHRVETTFQWIQQLIINNISNGILAVPPPILSRAFQELGNGMVMLHDAQKISRIQFPFPYAQTCDMLLILHWLTTPVITCSWTNGVAWACVFAFIQVFILWCLTCIAVEIENPFGHDDNDLDAPEMQIIFNNNLLLLLDREIEQTPKLSKEAVVEEGLIEEMHKNRLTALAEEGKAKDHAKPKCGSCSPWSLFRMGGKPSSEEHLKENASQPARPASLCYSNMDSVEALTPVRSPNAGQNAEQLLISFGMSEAEGPAPAQASSQRPPDLAMNGASAKDLVICHAAEPDEARRRRPNLSVEEAKQTMQLHGLGSNPRDIRLELGEREAREAAASRSPDRERGPDGHEHRGRRERPRTGSPPGSAQHATPGASSSSAGAKPSVKNAPPSVGTSPVQVHIQNGAVCENGALSEVMPSWGTHGIGRSGLVPGWEAPAPSKRTPREGRTSSKDPTASPRRQPAENGAGNRGGAGNSGSPPRTDQSKRRPPTWLKDAGKGLISDSLRNVPPAKLTERRPSAE